MSRRIKARPAVRLMFWQVATRNWGPDHAVTRAFFGRYVGSRGGVLSAVGSGPEAWVANYRELGHAGFRNRTWRRHLAKSLTPQGPNPGPFCQPPAPVPPI